MNEGWLYLNDLSWAYRAARVLHAAARLRVFSHLKEGPLAGGELAALCGGREELLERVLIACCAMGLLRRAGGRYENTELAATYLVEGEPLYQGDMILHAAATWDFWTDLPGAVDLSGRGREEADRHRSFILAMHNITMGGRGQLFLDACDLSGRRRLLDVGGGPGTYSVLACRKWPQLEAVVFDLPETVAIARERIRAEGLEDRITCVEGSWDADELPGGFDAVLLSNVLHGAGSGARMKLEKAWRALEAGGVALVQEFVLNDTKSGPLTAALFNVMVGAYSRGELLEVLREAGFEDPRVLAESEAVGATWVAAEK